MDRGADLSLAIDLLMIGDFAAHHVQPLGVVHHLLGNEQFAIYETAELGQDLFDAITQLRRMQ